MWGGAAAAAVVVVVLGMVAKAAVGLPARAMSPRRSDSERPSSAKGSLSGPVKGGVTSASRARHQQEGASLTRVRRPSASSATRGRGSLVAATSTQYWLVEEKSSIGDCFLGMGSYVRKGGKQMYLRTLLISSIDSTLCQRNAMQTPRNAKEITHRCGSLHGAVLRPRAAVVAPGRERREGDVPAAPEVVHARQNVRDVRVAATRGCRGRRGGRGGKRVVVLVVVLLLLLLLLLLLQ